MDDFSVADVYEHAAKIGQDIDLMIREYGEKSVQQIMPKIVFILEQLEGLAEKVQRDTTVISDLNTEKEKLAIECKKETALKRQVEEKVDYLEQLLNEDTRDLQSTISKLTEENEFLKSEVEQLDEEVVHQKTSALPGDIDLMVKMKATIDAQRDQVRQLSMQEERHKTEIDALNEQTNRLTEMNERLRLYNRKLQDRLTKTVEHKVQAEATLASVQIVNDDNNDQTDSSSSKQTEVVNNHTSNSEPLNEESEKKGSKSQHKGSKTKEEPAVENGAKTKDTKTDTKMDNKRDSNIKENANSDASKKEEPVKKDPNRPRYTLGEMQQVLEERNRYKEKVSILEEVLEAYLPSTLKSSKLESPDEILRKRKESKSKSNAKKESKVRGIFGSFWKESSKD